MIDIEYMYADALSTYTTKYLLIFCFGLPGGFHKQNTVEHHSYKKINIKNTCLWQNATYKMDFIQPLKAAMISEVL